MKQILILLALFLFVVSGYAAERESERSVDNRSDSPATPSPPLVWMDAETGQILFTVEDIIAFDWDQQVFHLKLDAALDFLAWMVPHKYQYRDLVLKDSQGIIHRGKWVNPISSMGFGGPIYTSLGANPFFLISDRYPLGKAGTTNRKDTRFAACARLHTGLKKAGVLHSIDLQRSYVGLAIDRVTLTWHDCDDDLKIRVEYFANTFLIGREARAHIFFSGGHKILPQIDDIALEIKVTANEGRFRTDVRIEGISTNVITDGIYVCRFRPWKSLPGSLPARPGTGHISLSVLLRRTIEGGSETLHRLDFHERDVIIGGRIRAKRGVPPDQRAAGATPGR